MNIEAIAPTLADADPTSAWLRAVAVSESWEAALVLPSRYLDLSAPAGALDRCVDGTEHVLVVEVIDAPTSHYERRGGARLCVWVRDSEGNRAKLTAFGVLDELRHRLQKGAHLTVLGTVSTWRDTRQILVREIVPADWMGNVIPVYPRAGTAVSLATMREAVHSRISGNSLARAARHLRELLGIAHEPPAVTAAIGLPGWTFEQLLAQLHLPASLEHASCATRAAECLSALVALRRGRNNAPAPAAGKPWQLQNFEKRKQAWPCAWTNDQTVAATQLRDGIASGTTLRALVCGEVGSGKTWVYMTIAAALADAGGRTLILAPNLPLCTQLWTEATTAFPDLSIALLAGETKSSDAKHAQLVIGTTAANHRALGSFDLVIVDEQQKLGVSQREHHQRDGVHVIECSATTIPRSLALAACGYLTVAVLRECPFEKRITTRLVDASAKADMFRRVKQTLARGKQVLVVYPRRGERGSRGAKSSPADARLPTVQDAFARWAKIFPGQVRMLTGADDDDVKTHTLDELRQGCANILLSTVLIETGLTLPLAEHVVVCEAHLFGLSTLHQIRGRIVRHGGAGDCDLYADGKISEDQRARLQVLVDCSDGFEVARRDLDQRGWGDLSKGATRQSGADQHCFRGRRIPLAALEDMLPALQAME